MMSYNPKVNPNETLEVSRGDVLQRYTQIRQRRAGPIGKSRAEGYYFEEKCGIVTPRYWERKSNDEK